MILYKNMRYITDSDHPNDDWVGDGDYVIPDGSELAEKIIGLYPNFKIVPDDDGGIAVYLSILLNTSHKPNIFKRISLNIINRAAYKRGAGGGYR